MDRRSAHLRAFIVALTAASMAAAPSSFAQTLADPNPPPKAAPPAAPKAAPAKHVKSCAAFGAGFVQMPGTDACIKVGGFVDGSVSTGR